MEKFLGYHSEWNLGSPGGWEYQRICQELAQFSWERLSEITKVDVTLDFSSRLFNPTIGFSEMLLSAHERRYGKADPFIVLVAEEETIGKVLENNNLISYLNSKDGISAEMAAPHELKAARGKVQLRGRDVSIIFMDFNNDVLLDIEKRRDLGGLRAAISEGIVVNPRGMEPVGAKGVFEAMTTSLKDRLTQTTVMRTPWTRRFHQRSTTGPGGGEISDLVGWTKKNQKNVILKPEHGYSGKGIYVGPMIAGRDEWEESVKNALEHGGYIVQEFIPINLWSEKIPTLNPDTKTIRLETYQTDFRCFITHEGLIGFCARFGGVPTNVGSGGGVQAVALLSESFDVKSATEEVNRAILSVGYEKAKSIADEVNNRAVEMGFTYLLGPIRTALRPRIINQSQMEALGVYAKNLWDDSVVIEAAWRNGELEEIIDIPEATKALSLKQPWEGAPALIASDGLFSFGANIEDG
jgi:hypothetical protein